MGDPFRRVLQFKAHLRLEPFDSERAFLLGERERFMLAGRTQVLLASLLDGRRSVRDILAALEGQVSSPEAFYVLSVLERQGFLVDATPELPPDAAAFWQSLGVAPADASKQLATSPVSVRALDGLDPMPLTLALRDMGLSVQNVAPLQILLVRDYLHPALEDLNRDALARHQRWVLVKPTGAIPWMGPVFRPNEGPCWECLAQRLRWNQPVETFLRARKGAQALTPPRAELPPSLQAATQLAALSLARWLVSGGQGPLSQSLVTLDLTRLQLTEHTVVRRPQCPACGDSGLMATRAAQPVVLEPCPRRFTEDNGYRSVSPEETFARHQHHISPLTGVLSSLGPIEGRNHPLRPVFGAVYFTPPREDAPSFDDFHSMSAGKGRTPAQSRASALCEGLERVSAFFQGDEPRVRARLASLEGAIHPHALLNFSEAQYREREALSARYGDPRRAIPVPFDERWEVDWTPAWSLTHERRCYLPSAWCFTRYPLPPEMRFCQQDSNGQAAGNCLEEAILQGFLELVERDAIALWWYGRLRRPGVDLRSFDAAYAQALEAHYREQGWRIWALDLTHDLGLPTFAALGRSTVDGRSCAGFGTHLDARLALQRALTELNQLHDPQRTLPPPWDMAALEDPSFLYPDETVPLRTPADFPTVESTDLRENVRTCVERAARAGLETLVLDLTRPDIGLNVVKVAVPGLRHFWPRFAPGRLYEVPVRLGWRSAPLTEAQLNPVPLFL